MKGIITSKTDKYIYTAELVTTTKVDYYIEMVDSRGRKSRCCQVYESEEAALADASYICALFDTRFLRVVSNKHDKSVVVHHRYRNKGQ